MFPTIESFNMVFFPALIAIVAAILTEEKIANHLERKRGKRNGTDKRAYSKK